MEYGFFFFFLVRTSLKVVRPSTFPQLSPPTGPICHLGEDFWRKKDNQQFLLRVELGRDPRIAVTAFSRQLINVYISMAHCGGYVGEGGRATRGGGRKSHTWGGRKSHTWGGRKSQSFSIYREEVVLGGEAGREKQRPEAFEKKLFCLESHYVAQVVLEHTICTSHYSVPRLQNCAVLGI